MITVVAFILTALLAVAIYIAVLLGREVFWLREELQTTTDHENAKCMAAVMHYVGNEWAAQVLDVAADDYASAANHPNLDRIGRLKYQPGGDPVPTIWMRERADRLRILDPETHSTQMNFNEVAL